VATYPEFGPHLVPEGQLILPMYTTSNGDDDHSEGPQRIGEEQDASPQLVLLKAPRLHAHAPGPAPSPPHRRACQAPWLEHSNPALGGCLLPWKGSCGTGASKPSWHRNGEAGRLGNRGKRAEDPYQNFDWQQVHQECVAEREGSPIELPGATTNRQRVPAVGQSRGSLMELIGGHCMGLTGGHYMALTGRKTISSTQHVASELGVSSHYTYRLGLAPGGCAAILGRATHLAQIAEDELEGTDNVRAFIAGVTKKAPGLERPMVMAAPHEAHNARMAQKIHHETQPAQQPTEPRDCSPSTEGVPSPVLWPEQLPESGGLGRKH